MTENQTLVRGARVIYVPPPLYYVVGLAGGLLLDRAWSLPLGGRPLTAVAGIGVAAAGLGLAFSGVAAVIRHRTTIVPHHAVRTLITTGVYRWSRNPMYAGLALAYLGISLLAGSWWPILLEPAVVALIAVLVIRPEEAYLAQRFGQEFADYRRGVRRWL